MPDIITLTPEFLDALEVRRPGTGSVLKAAGCTTAMLERGPHRFVLTLFKPALDAAEFDLSAFDRCVGDHAGLVLDGTPEEFTDFRPRDTLSYSPDAEFIAGLGMPSQPPAPTPGDTAARAELAEPPTGSAGEEAFPARGDMYELCISYDFALYPMLDNVLEVILDQRRVSSGAGRGGRRDLQFVYPDCPAMNAAIRRLHNDGRFLVERCNPVVVCPICDAGGPPSYRISFPEKPAEPIVGGFPLLDDDAA